MISISVSLTQQRHVFFRWEPPQGGGLETPTGHPATGDDDWGPWFSRCSPVGHCDLMLWMGSVVVLLSNRKLHKDTSKTTHKKVHVVLQISIFADMPMLTGYDVFVQAISTLTKWFVCQMSLVNFNCPKSSPDICFDLISATSALHLRLCHMSGYYVSLHWRAPNHLGLRCSRSWKSFSKFLPGCIDPT